MRPGQQNRRPRGRPNNNNGSNNNSSNNGNNNNRGRQQNPLARSYESSGPDVKIRGNAQHVAERYAQLARDSLSSGDRVMAENYLQHAEHYNRIIAAAMLQQAQFSEQQRREWDEEGSEGEEGDDNTASDAIAETGQGNDQQTGQPQGADNQSSNQSANQPSTAGQTGNRDRNNAQSRPDRPERAPRPERNFQERNSQDRNGQERQERQPRASFVAPLDESQPVIEGTPAEFANAESAGLARTLGLTAPRLEKPVAETATGLEPSAAPVEDAAPRAPRPRRAPRKAVDAVHPVEPADAAPETGGE